MTFKLTSPITGAPQTGLTSPTYTIVDDVAPTAQGRQVAVTGLGGTQTGVVSHSGSSPFTLNFVRPRVLKSIQAVLGQLGLIKNVPVNEYKLITRKGVVVFAGQPARPMVIETVVRMPAGADTADSVSVRAAMSAHLGALSQQSAGLGDTLVSGIV